LVLFKFGGDNARVFQQVSMNLMPSKGVRKEGVWGWG